MFGIDSFRIIVAEHVFQNTYLTSRFASYFIRSLMKKFIAPGERSQMQAAHFLIHNEHIILKDMSQAVR